MTKALLPMHEMPGVIRESARCVLNAHQYRVVGRDGNPISQRDYESLLSELGRNSSQALMSLDCNADNNQDHE